MINDKTMHHYTTDREQSYVYFEYFYTTYNTWVSHILLMVLLYFQFLIARLLLVMEYFILW